MKFLGLALILTFVATASFARPSSCRSWQGMEVPYLGDASLETVGGATQNARGRNLILLNPDLLMTFPPLARDFFLAHECGHQALTPNYNTEAEADCFAMRRLRKKLVRTPEQVQQLQADLRALPADAWPAHAPDTQRIGAIAKCGAP